MNRHFSILIALFLLALPVLALGSQRVVDEEVVFSYSKAVQAGDRAAIKTVFALNTDGASAEAQDIVLGKLIPKHPALFLKMLQHSQFANRKACLPGLLGNLGADYVDRPIAQKHELIRRRDALASVHITSLEKLRNQCVAELNDQVRELQPIIGAGGG
jgi:hypothetical protein